MSYDIKDRNKMASPNCVGVRVFRYCLSDLIFSGAIGFLVAFMFFITSLVHLNDKVQEANDRVERIQLQYQDCRVIGDYPGNADIITGLHDE